MVAAGPTVLMAASEENSSNEEGNGTARSTNQSTCSRYELQRCGQRNVESSIKGDGATCSLNIIEKKQRSLTTENNDKVMSKELKESSKNLTTCKTAQIRETRTSRLRAASIVLPNADVTLSSKKLLGSETSDSQRHNSLSKQKNSTSIDVTMNSVKERDKSYKRKSYLNRSRHVEAAPVDHSSEVEFSERHSRKQYVKRGQVSETVSSSADSCRQMASLRRKHIDSKVGAQYITKNLSKTYSSSSVVPTNAKHSIMQQSSGSIGNSEVSRRVDELTALTRATMERVERLASATTSCGNNSIENAQLRTCVAEKVSMSPKKCITPRHTPVSILKHKTVDGGEGGDRQASTSGSHAPSPVTFSPSVTEPVSHKRHGILKKRSSLDESEILRRRSCSPDVSFADNIYSEFRPILKNQRRSSLDEIVKRDQSPDQQPASILKRKSSREDDREIHRLSLGSPEPQSILKRKLANSVRVNSVNHHVTIASDVASTNVASGNTIASTNASLVSENLEGSEVKPILKKKYGKEELTGNDISSLEPRPILKKKSSTESDEHEHDKPKKTILKSSRKNSYEEGSYETELTSPRRLSVLKNRASEIENVRPILKQPSGSRYYDDTCDLTADSFLRKRAQSVSHARSANGDDCVESIRVLAKRRSLESSSPIDMLYTPTTTRRCFTADRSNETFYAVNSSGAIKENKLSCEGSSKIKQVANSMEEKNKIDSHKHFMRIDNDVNNCDAIQIQTQTIDKKETIKERQEGHEGVQDVDEDYAAICRSNSVSKMTQHFKVLQEKANAAAAENSSQRVPSQKLSRGIQRYRERKIQSGERFNTQPVTLEEVREAVLQNQRNATTLSNAGTTDNEPEPSKLSLAERVRLFNQKITTTETVAGRNTAYQEKFIQRRRQSTRYKTQPVTSEEVEVASRISPLNLNHQIPTLVEGHLKECQRSLHSPPLAITSQHDIPKSILKSSAGYTQNLSRAKSPELRGMKLIRSVLKKESEESEQPMLLPSAEVYPRSILKSNPYSRPIISTSTTSVVDVAATSRNERSLCSVESQNFHIETCKFCETEKLDCFNVVTNNPVTRDNLRDLCEHEMRAIISKQGDNMENKAAVPSLHKAALFRNEEILLADVNNCRIDTISSSALERRSNERHDNSLTNKSNRALDVDDNNKDDENDDNDDENNEKDSGKEEEKLAVKMERNDDDVDDDDDGHKIHNIVANEKSLTSVAQCSINSLAKSISQHSLGEERWKQQRGGLPLPGLCRSATQVIASIETSETPSVSIADRLAALRHNGSTNWKRRVAGARVDESCDDDSPLTLEESTIKSGVLADCIEKLESAVDSWKSRIVEPDAVNFTVAGKMKIAPSKDVCSPFLTEATANISNQKKKAPRPQWLKMRKDKERTNDAESSPASPCKESSSATHTSFSEPSDDSGEECKTEHVLSPSVSVPKTDDETFTSFFSGVSLEKCETECLDLDESDFDIIAPQYKLLVQKRNIQMQRRRATARNPLKVLAARTDLRSEYTEIRTNTTARMTTNLNMRQFAQSSSFAIEALAGLASTEDFSTVTLRNVSEASVSTNKLRPYKDIMLLLIKGRRHVQVRLIEPVAESINNGDSYILVTKLEIFNYIGKYSNIIEKTRAAEIALSIQQQKDLGCQAVQVITINEDKLTCSRNQVEKFWSYLGVVNIERLNVVEAGHPDEDELYESAIIDTNMVYELKDEQLVLHEKFWGTLPKIEMLNKNKILVFDFGTEMYIWSGKGISADKKKLATQLATEMWNNGYDYSECSACPIIAAHMIGNRNNDLRSFAKFAKNRPEWCLLAKLTQHVETILFREKFLDWPNVTGAVKTRGRNDNERQIDGAITVHLDENDDMWLPNSISVDFILEGCHLGRGTGCYDNELKKEYVVATTSVLVWHIDEFSHTLLDGSSIGQFYSGDSYIIHWTYSVTITGRELSGLPSKHSAKGRDRSVYFIWQGRNASLNERGAAALLTVELDSSRGPQIHVVQGHEPAAFLNLFSGRMVVHSGKKSDNEKKCEKRWRLYICQGTLENETFLIEIPCSTRQLRSRGSFILLDTENARLYVWHGNNSLRHIRENALKAANKLKENQPEEAGLSNENNIQIYEVQEGLEPEGFSNALGGINKKLYWSLETADIQDYTPKLYYLSSISKKFRATEILCPYRCPDLTTPFPFSQDDLYQANQPALFLLDDKNVIWIWQGWWPDNGTEDQYGSKTVRWQAERRAAMTIAIRYWRKTRSAQTTNLPIYLIWAGLEPLQFTNLFPEWTYRDDVAELNIEDGRNPGEVLTVENELARLTQSTYPPAQLLQRPLPDGVDPTRLELYLSQQHFQELLGMSKEKFQQLPVWKQVNLKKDIGLF